MVGNEIDVGVSVVVTGVGEGRENHPPQDLHRHYFRSGGGESEVRLGFHFWLCFHVDPKRGSLFILALWPHNYWLIAPLIRARNGILSFSHSLNFLGVLSTENSNTSITVVRWGWMSFISIILLFGQQTEPPRSLSTLIGKKQKNKITHHCHYDKNQPKIPLCLIKNHPPMSL